MGWLHVDEMLNELTVLEFDEMYIANQLDPPPEDRADENFALLCDILCKLHGDKTSTINKWRPKWDAEPKSAGEHEADMRAEINKAAEKWNKRAEDETSGGDN